MRQETAFQWGKTKKFLTKSQIHHFFPGTFLTTNTVKKNSTTPTMNNNNEKNKQNFCTSDRQNTWISYKQHAIMMTCCCGTQSEQIPFWCFDAPFAISFGGHGTSDAWNVMCAHRSAATVGSEEKRSTFTTSAIEIFQYSEKKKRNLTTAVKWHIYAHKHNENKNRVLGRLVAYPKFPEKQQYYYTSSNIYNKCLISANSPINTEPLTSQTMLLIIKFSHTNCAS